MSPTDRAVATPVTVPEVAVHPGEALVQTLVASTVNSAGSLPLLQFALAELWERRPVGRPPGVTSPTVPRSGGEGPLEVGEDAPGGRRPRVEEPGVVVHGHRLPARDRR